MNPQRCSISLSSAPGRPGQEQSQDKVGKRRRVPTGSPKEQNSSKSLRQESPVDPSVDRANQRKEAWEESIENADLVGEATISPMKDNEGLAKKLDNGHITSITGTPSKTSIFLDSNSSSPIISKSKKISNTK